ncbi:SAS complex subunit [Sporothrix epigloea]|uniref:SAS complex subunit n=1 Tax=Sporothrix epigloea TaxID=1892477 RepID=A0ABP0D769_9PEZI
MPPTKRKQPEDEEEYGDARAGMSRHAFRQIPSPSPALPAAPKDVPQRRALRGNTGSDALADDGANDEAQRGMGRTRLASGTSRVTSGRVNKDEDGVSAQDPTETDKDERAGRADCSPRTKRRLTRKAAEEKAEKTEPEQHQKRSTNRQRRGGRSEQFSVSTSDTRTTTAPLTTVSQRARRKANDIADVDEAAKDHIEAGDESKEEREEDDEKSAKGEIAAPSTTNLPETKQVTSSFAPSPSMRRGRRPGAAHLVVAPVSPPNIPCTRQNLQIISDSIPPFSAASNLSPPQSPVASESNLDRSWNASQGKPAVALAPSSQESAPGRPSCPAIPGLAAPAQALPPMQLAAQTPPQNLTAMQQVREEAAPIAHDQLQRQRKQPRQQTARQRRQTIVGASAGNQTTAPHPAATLAPAASLAMASTAPSTIPSTPDRNIEKVVLGEICFKAWYPSYYGKEVLGDTTGNSHPGRNNVHQAKGTSKENRHNAAQQHTSGSGHGGRDKEGQPILDRLYVCPYCFKYSKEIVPWHGHVQVCESSFQIPGERIYNHPQGVRKVRVPVPTVVSTAAASTGGKRRRVSSEADMHHVEQTVKDEGEWSVWEVDGERDVLFCQNLSLFAKLFLDNKSVFFDVTGFYYFLLVYTPPPSLPSSLREITAMSGSPLIKGGSASSQASLLGTAPRPRVVGFFSKEKMSWDNNNLACILVFPPWQRKGLGALLMGISYEVSRREGVLGGPEKPISDLGKKGYKRFWGAEIARWLLSIDIATAASLISLPTPTSSAGSPTSASRTTAISLSPPIIPPPPLPSKSPSAVASDSPQQESLIIDIADCSRATWIAREDCLYVLRDIGVEDAGMGLPKEFCGNVLAENVRTSSFASSGASGAVAADTASFSTTDTGSGPLGSSSASSLGPGGVQAATYTGSGPVPVIATGSASTPAGAATAVSATAPTDVPKEVQYVRISKAAIRQWVKDNRISLERPCDPAGFIKTYSNKDHNP